MDVKPKRGRRIVAALLGLCLLTPAGCAQLSPRDEPHDPDRPKSQTDGVKVGNGPSTYEGIHY